MNAKAISTWTTTKPLLALSRLAAAKLGPSVVTKRLLSSSSANMNQNLRGENTQQQLEAGITGNGTGYHGVEWNVLGQKYYAKAISETTFSFEMNAAPGDFVPVHVHPKQDEFILVQEGVLDLKLDGNWTKATVGDLVRMPMGVPHGYFNKSDENVRALFWVSPSGKLMELFHALHDLTDVEEVIRLSAEHEVDFLPPEASE